MSQKHEAHISVWEDVDWRGTVHQSPFALYVDSESLSVNKNIRDLANLAKDGRVSKVESQVGANLAPAGNVTFEPRTKDSTDILFSHFQTGTSLEGASTGTYKFFPSKKHPTYNNAAARNEGTYGGTAGDVYSVSFLKKYFDTTENGGTNSIYFEHGICDTLGFDITAGAVFKMSCDFKFRDVIVGTAISGNPPSADYGSYSCKAGWDWFEGTVLVGGEALNLDSIKWECKNNLTPKFITGRQDADWFAFGDHVTEGAFNLGFPKDGMLQVGSMLGTKSFSITGTLSKSSNDVFVFDMPNCIRKPFDVSLNSQRVDASIPFIALEKDGTSPITLTTQYGTCDAWTDPCPPPPTPPTGSALAVPFDSSKQNVYTAGGTDWSVGTLPSAADWRGIALGDGTWVTVSTVPISCAISTDGLNWGTGGIVVGGTTELQEIDYSDGRFVALGKSLGRAYYSDDYGSTWQTGGTLPVSQPWTNLVVGGTTFVAARDVSSNDAAYSNDGGETWAHATFISSETCRGIAYGDGTFCAMRDQFSSVSTDRGATWSQNGTTPITSGGVAYGNGLFVAGALFGTKNVRSTDGINWGTGYTMPFTSVTELIFSGGTFIAIAYGTEVAYSTDGLAWELGTLPVSHQWGFMR